MGEGYPEYVVGQFRHIPVLPELRHADHPSEQPEETQAQTLAAIT